MEDSERIRCDSLDSGSCRLKEAAHSMDPLTFDPMDPDPEPSSAELAQCEAEVGTLLNIIAELNKKMGSLKAPSEPGDLKPLEASRPLVPDLLSHRLLRRSPDSNPSLSSRYPGGSNVMWSRLQDVLSSVEESISCRRTWAAPITAYDQEKQREHLRAAQDSRAKATQILEEMERDFGISIPPDLPDDKDHVDMADVDKHDCDLKLGLQAHQAEQERAQGRMNELEEEKLLAFHRSRRSGSHSSPYRPSGGALSPDWASPPFPASPLLLRRTPRAGTPLSTGGEMSPLAATRSGSPCGGSIVMETETERLYRYIDKLKARNERLTAALERRKGESELISITLNKLEADCSALQRALTYYEECEEAYSELLTLCGTNKLQSIPLQTDSAAEQASSRSGSPAAPVGKMAGEELSTSFSTAGVMEVESQSDTRQRASEAVERQAALRQHIERLKRDRAAISLPKPCQGTEGKPGQETTVPAKCGHVSKDGAKPSDKKEKSSLFYELISVREEMSDLRALIRLKEKELRCLEWGLVAEKAHNAAGTFMSDNLREELEERKAEQQRLPENAARLVGDEDMSGPLSRPILRELQAVMHREQALKRRLALVHDSMSAALTERRDSGEQIARLTQAHSKALNSYRQMRRKYREQVWRLEQRVAAMADSHQPQAEAPKASAEEWRREETVL